MLVILHAVLCPGCERLCVLGAEESRERFGEILIFYCVIRFVCLSHRKKGHRTC